MRLTLATLSLLAVLCLAAPVVMAAPACTATNRVATENYPGYKNIYPSNNLLLPAGKSIEADGNRLIITGQVLDPACKPIPEATVELWQNNPYGHWLRATDSDLVTPYPTFTGTGRTYTDVEGRFSFTTAFPAPLKDRAPFVNLRVKIPGNGNSYATAVFFEHDARNSNDPVYVKLSEKTRRDAELKMAPDADGTLVGTIKIVLPAPSPYRTY